MADLQKQEKIFRYKLDFYYQSALIYLVTMAVYGVIRGSVVEKRFEYVLDDPLMYVILFFVLMSLVTLGLNALRRRRLILTKEAIVFAHRWHERRVLLSHIEWMHIGREARVQTAGRFQVIVFKVRDRRRLFRVRVGRYERERELVAEMHRIASGVPMRKRGRWRRPIMLDR